MSKHHEFRLVELVERAHPRRIARHADEWQRCATILEDAALRIEGIAARQSEIGGLTGPSMATATALASDVLRVKARDLRRGGDALAEIADATEAHQEEKRRIDRAHPDDGNHVVWREEGSRVAADGQEAALLRGIAVMKSIDVGEDPRRAPIRVDGPAPIVVEEPTWWPPREPRPEPPLDISVDPDEDPGVAAVPQGPTGGVSVAGGPTAPAALTASGLGGSTPTHLGGLAGAAVLGTAGAAGAVVGGRALGGAAASASGARAIGVGGATGSGGVLGRSGSGGSGAGAGGRGRRKRDREDGQDRDLYDDGEGWLDDEAGPGVLR